MKKLAVLVSLSLFMLFAVIRSMSFPKVLSSYYSKEVCSCLFVVKQSEKYCNKLGAQVLPNWFIDIDKNKKQVSAWGLFHFTKARYLSPSEGCKITD